MSPSGLDSPVDAGPPAAPGVPVAPEPQPPMSSAATVTGTAIHDRVCVMGPGWSSVAEKPLKNCGAGRRPGGRPSADAEEAERVDQVRRVEESASALTPGAGS